MPYVGKSMDRKRNARRRQLNGAHTAVSWNAAYPVGTAVRYWPFYPPVEGVPPLDTTTRSEAWTLGDGKAPIRTEDRMTKETNEVERDELLERLRRVAHGSPSDWAMYATPVDYLDAVARIERVTRERDQLIAKSIPLVVELRARAEKAEAERALYLDQRNEWRASALGYQDRAEKAERERDEERRLADLRGERLSKVEAALADALARLEEAEGRGSDA